MFIFKLRAVCSEYVSPTSEDIQPHIIIFALGAEKVGKMSRGQLSGGPLLYSVSSHSSHINRVEELCESRGSRPGLSVQMSLTETVDVKQQLNHA